jgi:hypothetical protein
MLMKQPMWTTNLGLLFVFILLIVGSVYQFYLTLEQVVNGGTTNNFTKVIIDIMLQFGGFLESNLVSKFISFGAGWILCFLWIKN